MTENRARRPGAKPNCPYCTPKARRKISPILTSGPPSRSRDNGDKTSLRADLKNFGGVPKGFAKGVQVGRAGGFQLAPFGVGCCLQSGRGRDGGSCFPP